MYELPSISELEHDNTVFIYINSKVNNRNTNMFLLNPVKNKMDLIKYELIKSHGLLQSGFYDNILHNYKEILNKITSNKCILGKHIIIASTIIRWNSTDNTKYSPIELMLNIKQSCANLNFGQLPHNINEKDIMVIMGQASCTFDVAVKALIDNNMNIVNAIMELTM